MRSNHDTLVKFHSAFVQLDVDSVATCYASDAQFDDEAFSFRGHEQMTGMWRMLCETINARALVDRKLVYCDIKADAKTGKAHWEADYRISATNRLVRNVINSNFAINIQGLITRHRDRFNFWNW